MFSDSFPSPLIRGDPSALHISSLFDSGLALQLHNRAKEIASANAIHVNNCELSCHILLLVFDVLDVIKSVPSVSSVMAKLLSLLPTYAAHVLLGGLGMDAHLN